MYIYKITNLINNKIYIGQTTRSVKKRSSEHYGCYTNSIISNAIKKHGKENFKIEVINEFTTIDELNYFEQYYISLFNSLVPHGYNVSRGGQNFYKKKQYEKKSQKKIIKIQNFLVSNPLIKSKKFHGVYKYKNNDNWFMKVKLPNGKYKTERSLSELFCAYCYDNAVKENNLKNYPMNYVCKNEVNADLLNYYGVNGRKWKQHIDFDFMRNNFKVIFAKNKYVFYFRKNEEMEVIFKSKCSEYMAYSIESFIRELNFKLILERIEKQINIEEKKQVTEVLQMLCS